MKPTETAPPAHPAVSGTRATASVPPVPPEDVETEEEAFYAAQEAALAELRTYFRNRPRRKA